MNLNNNLKRRVDKLSLNLIQYYLSEILFKLVSDEYIIVK